NGKSLSAYNLSQPKRFSIYRITSSFPNTRNEVVKLLRTCKIPCNLTIRLKNMDLAILFKDLQEHELQPNRLAVNEENNRRKKSITLVAASSKFKKEAMIVTLKETI
ncbi:hypothetical protein CR513_41677, partial [Mucuna pruriens]